MAIAFDTAGSQYAASSATATVNLTASGADRVAILFVITGNDAGGTRLSSITVNGSAATFVRKNQLGATASHMYMYYYIAPPTSSVAYTATCADATDDTEIHALLYTGAHQTTPVDSNVFVSAAGNLTATTTTVADNAWLVSCGRNTSIGPPTAGTGTTARNTPSPALAISGDSNDAKTPAGSYSMGWNAGSGTTYASLMSLAPSVAGSTINAIDFGHFA